MRHSPGLFIWPLGQLEPGAGLWILLLHSASPHPFRSLSSFIALPPRVKQSVETWVPPKQRMTLSWIGQKTHEAEGVTKLTMFGLQAEVSGHQVQILELRGQSVYESCHSRIWYGLTGGPWVYISVRSERGGLAPAVSQTPDHTA